MLDVIRSSGRQGATSKEVGRALGRPANAISGRFSELQRRGLIYRTSDRREGAAVWRALGGAT